MISESSKTPYFLHNDPRFSPLQSPWFTHEYITYFSIIPLWIMNLPPIMIQTNPGFQDWQNGPHHKDLYRENPINAVPTRHIPLEEGIDCGIRNGDFSTQPPEQVTVEPWKVLTLYSTEPDWELDVDLNLHWKQKITKGSHGYRHMQFSIFGFEFGKTLDTFLYYFRAAQKAWNHNNQYWAWRFLSRSTHYLADLGAPFHVKVFPYREFFKIVRNSKQAFHIAASMHSAHEVFTQYRFRTNFQPFKETIMQGARAGSQISINNEKDFIKLIKDYRQNARKLLSPLYYTMWQEFGLDIMKVLNLDRKSSVDSSKQIYTTEVAVQKIIFKNPSHPILSIIDNLTIEALKECGKIMGVLFELIKKYFKC